jgi:hypothetical protein
MPPEPINGAAAGAPTIRKHIFTPSGFAAMCVEDTEALANLKADLVALYRPVNSQELFAVERIALAQHSLMRAYRIEAGLVTLGLEAALDVPGVPPVMKNREIADSRNHNYWMASGFRQSLSKSSEWQLLLRYQAQCEVLGRRATEEFERLRALRALRGVLPEQILIEPEPAPAPEGVMPPSSEPVIAGPPDLPVPQPAETPTHAAKRRRKVRCIRPDKGRPFSRRLPGWARKEAVVRIREASPPDSS